MIFSKLYEHLKNKYIRFLGYFKKRKLKTEDFSIISNNCFGGIFYRDNAIPYKSPTCGIVIMAEDYIKFIYNLDYYLSIDSMEQLSVEQSKYKDFLDDIKYTGLIGKLDDIEIILMHYNNFNEAVDKWNRRKKRINKDRIIYKFNDQNLCTYEHLKKFAEFPAKNKICFTAKKYDNIETIQMKEYENMDYVQKDTNERHYKKYFDFYKYINERF